MNSGAKLFYAIGTFFVVVTVFYFIVTSSVEDSGNVMGVEWAGGTGLVLSLIHI